MQMDIIGLQKKSSQKRNSQVKDMFVKFSILIKLFHFQFLIKMKKDIQQKKKSVSFIQEKWLIDYHE